MSYFEKYGLDIIGINNPDDFNHDYTQGLKSLDEVLEAQSDLKEIGKKLLRMQDTKCGSRFNTAINWDESRKERFRARLTLVCQYSDLHISMGKDEVGEYMQLSSSLY